MPTHQTLQIRALGPLQITSGNGAPVALGQRRVRKPLELLRALVVAGPEGAAREALCESVWELPLAAAYRSLVTSVFRLRRLLGDRQAVVFSNRRVALNTSRCWVDSWAFEAALQPELPFSQARLEALALYRGTLFEGQFAPYLAAVRERCCQRFVEATLRAGRELVASGQLASAQSHFEAALQYEWRVEELFHALIDVLGRRGRAAAANIAYNSCAVAMRRYYGRLPAPETRAALEAALAHAEQTGAIPPALNTAPTRRPVNATIPGAQPAYA